MTTLHAHKKVTYTLQAVDSSTPPLPATLATVPVWTVSTTGAVSIAPAADGMSCEVTWLAPESSIVLTVTAQAGIAPALNVLTVSDTIETLAAVVIATALILTVGPEVDA